MTRGQKYIAELNRVFVIAHTRLHKDHLLCPICKVAAETVEEMVDHCDAHPERLNLLAVQKDGFWIVLVEPSEYYKAHPTELPETIVHLPAIADQSQSLGTEARRGDHLLQFLEPPTEKPN